MENVINTLHLSGKVVGTPVVGHEAFGEKFYYLTLGVERLSGAQDFLPVTLSERLLDGGMLKEGDTLSIEGQVRSYNKIIEGAGRLLITAFAQKIVESNEHENPNQIQLTGTLCKTPAYRTTPFGREIADMMLAVNRAYGKSDYIPCITWGRSARFAAKLAVGDKISLSGRRLFSCVSMMRVRKKSELPSEYIVVTFGLPAPVDSPRIAAKTEPYPNRWTHHVVIWDASEIDAELLGWLAEARAFSDAK